MLLNCLKKKTPKSATEAAPSTPIELGKGAELERNTAPKCEKPLEVGEQRNRAEDKV